MKLDNAGELVTLGTQIIRLGAELDTARIALATAQTKVLGLEGELRPLLRRHAELIQAAVGGISLGPANGAGLRAQGPTADGGLVAVGDPKNVAAPDDSVSGVGGSPGPNELSLSAPGTPGALPAATSLKNRVKDFLRTRIKDDEAISATDVAGVLHIDTIIVREAMLEMRHGR